MKKPERPAGRRFWAAIPPWVIIGSLVVLAPLFVFMTLQSIDKQKELTTRLLIEKGEALIFSFERRQNRRGHAMGPLSASEASD